MAMTITTWNVQNFTRSDDVFQDKLDFLAATLQALDPDVIALQEILDEDALGDLAMRLGFQAFAGDPDGRGNRVAFLTRHPPVNPLEQIDEFRLPPGIEIHRFSDSGDVQLVERFRRSALKLTISHGQGEIDIITAHFKSKLLTFQGGGFSTSDSTLRAHTAYFALQLRAAEAAGIREHVTELLDAERAVVVLGDLNDGPEAATTQILYGPPGSQPRGPEDASHAAGAFQKADQKDGQRLFNVTKLVAEGIRWTRRHNGQKELLDQIHASEGLMPRSNGLRQVPMMSILNEDTPNMIGDHPTAGGVVPDHAPVTATFV